MRLSVRFFAPLAAVAVLALCAGTGAYAQTSSSPSGPNQRTGIGTYTPGDPLAGVTYDNRYDVSLGMAYAHIKAGPNLLQGANLGGLDISGSYWLTKRWGAEGTFRPYMGTSGAGPNSANIKGPFVAQYIFAAGPEWLGPHNKHGDLIAHVLVGGAHGNFEQDLRGNSPSIVGFYNDQTALGMVMGGHIDLNRSAHWVFRITPDAILTRYGTNYGSHLTQTDINFAISVGLEYKFKRKR